MKKEQQLIQLLEAEGLLANGSSPESPTEILDAIIDSAGDRIFSFDTECCYDDDSYASILTSLNDASKEGKLTNISSFYDHEKSKAGVSFQFNGKEVKKDWDQPDDWAADQFFKILQSIQGKMDGVFLALPVMDQCFYAVYFSSPNSADKISTLMEGIDFYEI